MNDVFTWLVITVTASLCSAKCVWAPSETALNCVDDLQDTNNLEMPVHSKAKNYGNSSALITARCF